MKSIIKVLSICMVGLMTMLSLYAQPSSLPKGTEINLGGYGNIMQSPNGKSYMKLEYERLRIFNTEQNQMTYSNPIGGVSKLIVQNDGNVVIYNNWNSVVWETKTSGKVIQSLSLTDDGALVVLGGNSGKEILYSSVDEQKKRNEEEKLAEQKKREEEKMKEDMARDKARKLEAFISDFESTIYAKRKNVKPSNINTLVVKNTLRTGAGDNSIQSNSGVYRLVLQDDGNLVILKKDQEEIKNCIPCNSAFAKEWSEDYQVKERCSNIYKEIWQTNTSSQSGAWMEMQSDGNLVIYKGDQVLWASATGGRGYKGTKLVLQDDGNLVIYGEKGFFSDDENKAIWATGTCDGRRNGCGSEGAR
jgi:hypothetical protein